MELMKWILCGEQYSERVSGNGSPIQIRTGREGVHAKGNHVVFLFAFAKLFSFAQVNFKAGYLLDRLIMLFR